MKRNNLNVSRKWLQVNLWRVNDSFVVVLNATWHSCIHSCGYQDEGMFMLTCFDVADYSLVHCGEESGDIIFNLKIQKLTYYAQGFSLVLLGKPLFSEKIEAWMRGPVVPELYHKYRDCDNRALPAPENFDAEKLSEDEIELLDEVYKVYGQFSAWKLRSMTRERQPQKDVYIGGAVSQEITLDSMKDSFKTLIN